MFSKKKKIKIISFLVNISIRVRTITKAKNKAI